MVRRIEEGFRARPRVQCPLIGAPRQSPKGQLKEQGREEELQLRPDNSVALIISFVDKFCCSGSPSLTFGQIPTL